MYLKLLQDGTTEFPYNLYDLYKEYPNTSFPKIPTQELLNTYNVFSVVVTNTPQFDPKSHKPVQSVEKINNTWTQTWIIEKLEANTASNNVRNYRNRLLKQTDWTQTEDSPVNKASWKNYRQALRDITSQSGFPYEVIWPVPPA